MIEFDAKKDAANLAKHGISLARAEDMIVQAVVPDPYRNEPRLRAFGMIGGVPYCLIYVEREHRQRAISLRRAHSKEYVLNVPRH